MFKNSYIFIRNIVLLLLVGNTLYWLFPFRPIVWRLLYVLFSLFVVIFKSKKLLLCEKWIIVFAALNSIYAILASVGGTPTLTMIGNILCAMLSLCLFTCLSEHGVMSDKFIAFAGLILVVVAIPYYYHARLVVLEMMNADPDRDITNNGSSIFLMILPIVFLIKSNIQKWVTLMVCLFFIVLSAKRGNILAAVLPSMLFIYMALKEGRHSFFRMFAVMSAIIVSGYLIYNWTITNDYLLYRLEQTAEGDSSMRDAIYAGAWNAWYHADNPLKVLFGYGYNATLSISSMDQTHAHNDWLEILVDYGLFGFVVYLILFYSLYLQIRHIKEVKLKVALLAAVLIWFFKTLYSMGFTEPMMPILMITIGTVLGRYKRGEVN